MSVRSDIGLRLINVSLSDSALRHHDYDSTKLTQQGTTATHIVYSNLSKFDNLVLALLGISLTNSMNQKAFADSETPEDVTRAAVMIVKRIVEDVEHLAPTFAQAAIVEPLHELSLRITTQPELALIAPVVLALLGDSNLPQEVRAGRQVRLCWHVFSVCGIDAALELASRFVLYKTMTQMVYRGGPGYYGFLYQHIDAGRFPLSQALRVVYAYDKEFLKSAVAQETHIATYSDRYGGVKLLEIFERPGHPDYLSALHVFLDQKNRPLLAISLARERARLAPAEHILEQTVQQAQLLDTQESMACLGEIVSELNKRELVMQESHRVGQQVRMRDSQS